MKLRPLQDRVLIRLVEPASKSAGGILIPDTRAGKADGRRSRRRR